MKKIILTLAIVAVYSINTYAQHNSSSNRATWVIESQGRHAKTQTVNFYDDNAQLIYTETINAQLNINRKKVQRALNHILDSLLNQQGYRDNKNVLAASFKLKH